MGQDVIDIKQKMPAVNFISQNNFENFVFCIPIVRLKSTGKRLVYIIVMASLPLLPIVKQEVFDTCVVYF